MFIVSNQQLKEAADKRKAWESTPEWIEEEKRWKSIRLLYRHWWCRICGGENRHTSTCTGCQHRLDKECYNSSDRLLYHGGV